MNMSARAAIKADIRKRHNDIRRSLKCSLCLELYTEPVKLNVCDHRFCLKCYMTLFTSSGSPKTVPCPLCKQPTQRRGYAVDEVTASAVESLRDIERDVLPKLDAKIDTVQRNRNERKFVQRMQSKNKLQRWIDKGRKPEVKGTYALLDTSSEESGSDDDADSLNHPDNLKVIEQLDLLYFAKRKKKGFRRTKSLTNILTKTKRNTKKRHSTGNVYIADNAAAGLVDDDSVDLDTCHKEPEDNRILHLLEEDVLNNFEMEMFVCAGKDANNAPAKSNEGCADNSSGIKMNLRAANNNTLEHNISGDSNRNAKDSSIDNSAVSLNTSTAWSRMDSMRKDMKKTEGRNYKQLGSEVTKHRSKSETLKRKVVNLDDFEEYLSKNLVRNDGSVEVETPAVESAVEIKVEPNTSHEEQNTSTAAGNAGLNDDGDDDIFAVCTQKLDVTQVEAATAGEPVPHSRDTHRKRARKQQLIVNDLDEMRVITLRDNAQHDSHTEHANGNGAVHAGGNGALLKNEPPCADVMADVQTGQSGLATEPEVRSSGKRNRKSVNRKATAMHQSGPDDDKKSSRQRQLVSRASDDARISMSSNDELLSSSETKATKRSRERAVDGTGHNVMDCGGTDTSNVCPGNVRVRRSARIRKPSARITEQAAGKPDSPKAVGSRRSGIEHNATIDSSGATASQTSVQEEFNASLKSVLDQHTDMVARLQSTLNDSNRALSNYLTNSESLFTQSSASGDKAPSTDAGAELQNLADKPNTTWPVRRLSLTTLSGSASPAHASFFNTAIPQMRTMHHLYTQLKSLSSQLDNETENFTSIFSKSLLANGDSSKQSTANLNMEPVSSAKVTTSQVTYCTSASVQTERLTCPQCAYTFDISTDLLDLVPAPAEFSQDGNPSPTSVPLSARTGSHNQSSAVGSEIGCGRKVNRQLFSSDESERSQKRRFKRIRTPTPDSDSGPGTAKRAKASGEPGKMLYRGDLEVVFDSEAVEANVQDVFGGRDGIEYYEYMKKWLKRHDDDMEANAAGLEIDGNVARARRHSDRVVSAKGGSGASGKNAKPNTQDIAAAAYEKILEHEFKTVHQFTKARPTKPVQPPPSPPQIPDHFDTIPNTVLDNLFTNISFGNAANSTPVEKPADNKSVENTVPARSPMTASLFTAPDNVPNQSECEDPRRAESCYTDNIICASLLPEAAANHRPIGTRRSIGKKAPVDEDLGLLIVDEDQLDNEVADITCNRHDSMDSDKDMFGDDNIVEGTPHKQLLGQGDRSSIEFLNPIVELLDPPDTAVDNCHADWLPNIAPPSAFQDTEQMPVRPASPDQHCAMDSFIRSTEPHTSALNQGFRAHTASDANVIESVYKSCQNNVHSTATVAAHSPSTNANRAGWLSSSKNLNPLVLARNDKFSPLQVIVNRSPPPQGGPLSSTPKQKSILSYMATPQMKGNARGRASPLHTAATPHSDAKRALVRRDNVPTSSSGAGKSTSQFGPLNVIKTTTNRSACSTPVQPAKCTSLSGDQTASPNTATGPPTSATVQNTCVCIASTRLKKDELLAILTLATRYNARYSKEFTRQVTHLVVSVDEMNRVQDHTIKYILAIAHGLWVVSFAWVKDCLGAKRFVSEEAYEVLDVSGSPGPRLSRLSRASYPLLQGYVVHCAEPYVSVSRIDLENAIISLGGRIVPSLAELDTETAQLRLILSEAKVTQDFDHYELWRQKYRTLVVDIEWLSRSVGQYRVVSVRPFILCLEEDIDHMGYPYALIAVMAETPTQLTH